jgi:two-component system response regulator LytT
MPAKMRVVIVDDVFEARDELSYLLSKHLFVEVLAGENNPETAWAVIQENDVDVVFLDIRFDNIPEGEEAGFDLARLINQLDDPPFIVFISAYSEKALEAYNFFPFSFLPKPFDAKELDRILKQLLKELDYRLINPKPKKKLIEFEHKIKDKDGQSIICTEFVQVSDIVYIKTNQMEASVKIKLATGKTLNGVKRTLKSLLAQLMPYGLHIQISRDCIVAIKPISGIKHLPHNDTNKVCFKQDADELSIGPIFLKNLLLTLREQAWSSSE